MPVTRSKRSSTEAGSSTADQSDQSLFPKRTKRSVNDSAAKDRPQSKRTARKRAVKGDGFTKESAIVIDSSDSSDYQSAESSPVSKASLTLVESLTDRRQSKGKAKETHLQKPRELTPESIVSIPSPPSPPVIPGRKGWKADVEHCKETIVDQERVGYSGLGYRIQRIWAGDADDSLRVRLKFQNSLGAWKNITFDAVFNALQHYPTSYTLLLFSETALSSSAEKTFEAFSEILDLRVPELILRIIASLQGDARASGDGRSEEGMEVDEPSDQDYNFDQEEEQDEGLPGVGRGFEVAKGSALDLGTAWKDLKEHFAQAKTFDYRPGFTMIADYWVFSLSLPLKSLPLDPNTLAMWDDQLVKAWQDGQRLTLLVQTHSYPMHLERMQYSIGLDRHYKPSVETIKSTIRKGAGGLTPFYLSESLLGYLKTFAKAFKIRQMYDFDWKSADRIAFDHEECRRIFDGLSTIDPKGDPNDGTDPVGLGFGNNLALCAFHWLLRRFTTATDHCLTCGVEVKTRSLRPYVCDRPLCEYSYLTLGFGPSIEHVIQSQPGVVDLLLTFAHAAASSSTRMSLPLELNIEIPAEFGIVPPVYLIDLPDHEKRRAIVFLIERLPKVSEIKDHLDQGGKFKDVDAPSGSIGILRWVVGSCRAYLKGVGPGEGIVTAVKDPQAELRRQGYNYGHGAAEQNRQFTFVVGSPEQERDFAAEVAKAKVSKAICQQFPTFLAFHGSPVERWHNILRTGLDFQETANGRAYGNGVYFAHDAMTSLSGYSRSTTTTRSNADFQLSRAVACVELVNVPETFVSMNPYYVVDKVKQIKPFLLLVQGPGEVQDQVPSKKKLFKHDPSLGLVPSFFNKPLQVAMPDKYEKVAFVETEEDDEQDAKFAPTPPRFRPSPKSRFDRLQMMAPPSATSSAANRALSREFKNLMASQDEDTLPFYIDPETDSLYCWVLELWEFPKSKLKDEMAKVGVKSLVAELRFPASFPHSPPFMRVLHPRCQPFALGGGGNITAGGSVCHEILTATGWKPAFTIEAVVRDIMTNMTENERPARLDMGSWDRPYSLHEAMEAYKRVAAQHGWEVPKDFHKVNVMKNTVSFLHWCRGSANPSFDGVW